MYGLPIGKRNYELYSLQKGYQSYAWDAYAKRLTTNTESPLFIIFFLGKYFNYDSFGYMKGQGCFKWKRSDTKRGFSELLQKP